MKVVLKMLVVVVVVEGSWEEDFLMREEDEVEEGEAKNIASCHWELISSVEETKKNGLFIFVQIICIIIFAK